MTDAPIRSKARRTPPPDPKADLDRELARKARLEADQLESNLSPDHRRWEKIKAAAGASSLLLAGLSLIGGGASIASWFIEQGRNRELRVEERLDRALTQLSEARPAQRVAAVGSLASFLDRREEARNTRVVTAVANALFLEDDQIARNQMIAFFETLPTGISRPTLEAALSTLVVNNRGLVRDKTEWLEPPGNWYVYSSEDTRGRTLAASTQSITALLRRGARVSNMSSLYLVLVDFSDLDLSTVSFDDTLLNWSNFSNAKLNKASFIGANLDATNFERADLRDADFRYIETYRLGPRRFSFVSLNLPNHSPRGPDFGCADMRGAKFAGFPTVDISSDLIDEEKASARLATPSFRGANLSGADFREVGFFRYASDYRNFLFAIKSESGSKRQDDEYYLSHGQILDAPPTEYDPTIYKRSIADIQSMFAESTISGAKIPKALSKLGLQSAKTSTSLQLICEPRAPW
ncbi:MAG: pentapeptide repeat-containing protein [Caulobacter sp.]